MITIKKIIKKIIPRSLQKIIRKILNIFNNKNKVSDNYKIIKNPDLNELREKYNNAWKNNSLPYKQLKLTEKELIDFNQIAPMKVIVDLIKKIKLKEPSILEIGCSTGYYSEVFKRAGLSIKYEGCDYSPSFIEIAKQKYPDIKFKLADATKLDYQDKQFDIVISGCCILHIIDYAIAISEAIRVAKKFVIFHRTPVIRLNKTSFTKKMGYGTEMIEILFNEQELTNLFRKNNLTITDTTDFANFSIEGLNEPIHIKSYLCQKI